MISEIGTNKQVSKQKSRKETSKCFCE